MARTKATARRGGASTDDDDDEAPPLPSAAAPASAPAAAAPAAPTGLAAVAAASTSPVDIAEGAPVQQQRGRASRSPAHGEIDLTLSSDEEKGRGASQPQSQDSAAGAGIAGLLHPVGAMHGGSGGSGGGAREHPTHEEGEWVPLSLASAIEEGDITAVREALQRGENPNDDEHGTEHGPPLTQAAHFCLPQVVQLPLECGSEIASTRATVLILPAAAVGFVSDHCCSLLKRSVFTPTGRQRALHGAGLRALRLVGGRLEHAAH